MFTTHLVTLEEVGLLRPEIAQPEPRYGFRHALIQDAAYGSLMRADRRLIHQLVGEALEALYAEQTADLAPQLARHFAEAHNLVRAFHYAQLAADLAAARYANTEAITHYTHALALAQQLSPPPPTATWHHLYTRLGRAYELNSQYTEAVATYTALHTFAQAQANAALELAALTALALAHSMVNTNSFDPVQGEAECNTALALAHQLGDEAAEAKALWIMLLLHWYTNRPAEAKAYGEQALALARRLNLREQLAYILNDLGAYPYSAEDNFDLAVGTLAEAVALWRELHNLPMLVDALNHLSALYIFTGENAQAHRLLQEGAAIAQATGNLWGLSYNRSNTAHLYINEGRMDEGLALIAEALQWGTGSGMIFSQLYPRMVRILVFLNFGVLTEATQEIDIIVVALQERFPPLIADIYALRTLLFVAQGDLPAAVAAQAQARAHDSYLNNAWGFILGLAECVLQLAQGRYTTLVEYAPTYIAQMHRTHQSIFAAEGVYYYAQALRHLGQPAAARTRLESALPQAQSVANTHYLYLLLLIDLATELGDHTAAQAYRVAARQIVTHILAHTSDPTLRTAFQNQLSVRRLVEGGNKL